MTSAPLRRVFFDTNEGTWDHGYWLGFEKSREDLVTLGEALCDGARVIIYMPDELETEATLRFDVSNNVWLAYPVEGH